MESMIKTIIFDLDGTLLNSLEDLANSTNHTLKTYGFPTHPTEKYKYFVGNGIGKLLERALPEEHRNEAFLKEFSKRFLEYYNQHKEDCTKPYTGILQLLQQLNDEGFNLAVASNKIHSATCVLVEKYFPDISFSLVLGHRQGYLPKPDSKIIDDILNETNSNTLEAIMIGDSSVDIQTAKNANIKSIGVLWGFRTKEELQEAGADFTVSKPNEIVQIIRSLNDVH